MTIIMKVVPLTMTTPFDRVCFSPPFYLSAGRAAREAKIRSGKTLA